MADLIKIGIVILALAILTLKRVKLWISLLLGSCLLGLLFHLSLIEVGANLFSAALGRDTLLLMGALVTILFFSNLLNETGRIGQIMEGFQHLFRDTRVVIALIPAMIGLMPILGGALVSAPIVVAGSDELGLSAERRTFINYWFRHIWEYVLPTYPALVLSAALMEIPVRQMGWINLSLTLITILAGVFVGFTGVAKSVTGGGDLPLAKSGWRLFKNLFPLLIALALVVGFKVELVYAFGLTILGMVVFQRIGWQKVWKGFRGSLTPDLLLTVVLVMGFKNVLESSRAVFTISNTLSSSGIPGWLVAMTIPFVIGLMTGMTTPPIGIGFPVLIPLFRKDPDFFNYMMLAFGSGICGTLISPFHLCLVLTKDYFHADWKGVYRLVWGPVLATLAVAFVVAVLLRPY